MILPSPRQARVPLLASSGLKHPRLMPNDTVASSCRAIGGFPRVSLLHLVPHHATAHRTRGSRRCCSGLYQPHSSAPSLVQVFRTKGDGPIWTLGASAEMRICLSPWAPSIKDSATMVCRHIQQSHLQAVLQLRVQLHLQPAPTHPPTRAMTTSRQPRESTATFRLRGSCTAGVVSPSGPPICLLSFRFLIRLASPSTTSTPPPQYYNTLPLTAHIHDFCSLPPPSPTTPPSRLLVAASASKNISSGQKHHRRPR